MARLNYAVTSFWNTNAAFRGVKLQVNSNYSGTPQARIYLDGGAVPAFTNMAFIGGFYSQQAMNLAAGLYVVEYNDANGIRQLGKFYIIDDPADSCYPEFDMSSLGTVFFVFNDTGLQILTNFGIWLGHTVGESQAAAASKTSIDGGTLYYQNVYQSGSSLITSASWINSQLTDPIIDTVRIKRDSNSCVDIVALELNTLDELPALEASYEKTDCTANGSNDGTITIIVSGGSGNYSFEWADGPVTQNRSNLAPGFYSVTITDLETDEVVELENIQITEPSAPVREGSLLEVPIMNSIHFVVEPVTNPDGCSTMPTPDNQLLINQRFPGFQPVNYLQKVAKCDAPILQFNSDFSSHVVELRDYCSDALIKTFFPEIKENNIGQTEDFNILIRNHNVAGKSRVYFAAGPIPIPLSVGEAFEILNNVDGFNGNYLITDILLDSTIGYQYLVITLNYVIAAPSSAATGRFDTSTVDFNVYEAVLDVIDVADGKYYFKLRAFDDDVNFKEAYSEPIDLKVFHPNTNLVTGRNIDNGFNMTWQTGYITRVRIESTLSKRLPGGERSLSRNSDFSLVKTAAKKIRGFSFETHYLPPYLHEKLSVLFDCDLWFINGVQYQAAEGYADPDYVDRFLLASSSIKIEQVGWMDNYNSDDIGTINDGGKLMHESGFLMR